MADEGYDFNPASPDAHGWWPLFRIRGLDPDEDNEPLWDCAVYERPAPDQVLVPTSWTTTYWRNLDPSKNLIGRTKRLLIC